MLDNGVRQKVEIVAPSAAPVSVVLALDGSASLDAKERSHLTRASTRVIDALKPGESAALVTFSDRIAIQSAFTSDAAKLRALVAAPTPSGDTALADAAHVAMLLGTSAPGRPIVILFSDGDDTASFLTEDAVVETAQRTGAVVSVVMIGGEGRAPPAARRHHRRGVREGAVARPRRGALRRAARRASGTATS